MRIVKKNKVLDYPLHSLRISDISLELFSKVTQYQSDVFRESPGSLRVKGNYSADFDFIKTKKEKEKNAET